jgi:hypothetical protein
MSLQADEKSFSDPSTNGKATLATSRSGALSLLGNYVRGWRSRVARRHLASPWSS